MSVKSRFQQLLEAPKGGLEFNPSQTFALQVFWVVRSPQAAYEMIRHGFRPCSQATERDTPTTLLYLFRIAWDQSLAQDLRKRVKTIGQHPHYQSAFKSLQMGVPRNSVELKLRHGGIAVAPLDWSPDELIRDHPELDFDPVVLECTEVYLDNRGFYQHACSTEWMKASPEILQASRSLTPRTICVGNPTQQVWESSIESYLKATRFDDQEVIVQALNPGVFLALHAPVVHRHDEEDEDDLVDNDCVCCVDLDMVIQTDKAASWRAQVSALQHEWNATVLLVIPKNLDPSSTHLERVELRVTLSFPLRTVVTARSNCAILGSIANTFCETFHGRVIVFGKHAAGASEPGLRQAKHWFSSSGIEATQLEVVDAGIAINNDELAGYPLHALHAKLVEDKTLDYKP